MKGRRIRRRGCGLRRTTWRVSRELDGRRGIADGGRVYRRCGMDFMVGFSYRALGVVEENLLDLEHPLLRGQGQVYAFLHKFVRGLTVRRCWC
jgi:hypothetical protein